MVADTPTLSVITLPPVAPGEAPGAGKVNKSSCWHDIKVNTTATADNVAVRLHHFERLFVFFIITKKFKLKKILKWLMISD